MPRDYYEVLGVDRGASGSGGQEGLPPAGPRAAPRRQRPRPRGRGEVQGGRARPTRCSPTPSSGGPTTAFGHEGLRSGGWAPRSAGFGSIEDLFDAFFGGGEAFGFGRRGRRRRRRRRGRGRDHARRRARRAPGEVELRRGRRLRALPRQRRRARHADPLLRALRRRRPAAPGDADAARPDGPGRDLRRLRRRRPNRRDALRRAAAAAAAAAGAKHLEVDVPAGIEDGQRVRITGAGHAGEPGGRAGDLYVEVRVSRRRASTAKARTWSASSTCRRPTRCSAPRSTVPTLDGTRGGRGGGRHSARDRGRRCAASGCRACGGGRRGDQRIVFNVIVPGNLSEEQRELAGRLDETLGRRNLAEDAAAGSSPACAAPSAEAPPA